MDHEILNRAMAIQNDLTAHRRWLHCNAETGFELQSTTAYIRRELEKMGYSVNNCGRCGLTASLGKPGKTFLLRADMDALPIREETGLDYACASGNMHACGHDLHTAMLLGAARLLKELESQLNGTVKFMFQPAEEILSGAKDMMDAGVLNGVDAAMMIHVATAVPIPAGTLLVSPAGVSAPGADYFTIRVRGKSCHGSAPQEGVDAITAGAQILLALQELNAREIGMTDRAVLTIGTIQGGTAPNAIADSLTMRGTMRCFDEELRARLKQRLTEIATGIAAAFRAEAFITFDYGCPSLLNDESLCRNAEKWLTELLGPEKALSVEKLNRGKTPTAGGSEDFAWISRQVPSVMVSLAAGEPAKGHTNPLHHPQVTFDESALPYGAAALAYTALRYLKEA